MTVLNIIENFNRVINTNSSQVYNDKPKAVKEKLPETEKSPLPEKDAREVVAELNKLTGSLNEKVKFSLHEKTNSIIIRVMNADTNEVIREIPAKYSLRLLEHFQEHMGLFVDESM